jgi:hypothetical protein
MPFTLRPLKTLDDAVRHFIQELDYEMVELLIKDLPEQEPGEIQLFLRRLERALEYFKVQGDTHLNVVQGKCTGCYPKSSGFSFVGNVSKCYMNLIFHHTVQGHLDLMECNQFKTSFTAKNQGVRVYLDDESFRIYTLNGIDPDDVPF